MFKVRLQNFDSVPTEHASYDEALTRAKSIGFEATIWYEPSDNEFCLVASYSPLYGLHVHHRILAGIEPGLTMADAVAINGIPVKMNAMTKQEYLERFKQEPIQDDLERVNCCKAGTVGHSQCGICTYHAKPRFMCGCLGQKIKSE